MSRPVAWAPLAPPPLAPASVAAFMSPTKRARGAGLGGIEAPLRKLHDALKTKYVYQKFGIVWKIVGLLLNMIVFRTCIKFLGCNRNQAPNLNTSLDLRNHPPVIFGDVSLAPLESLAPQEMWVWGFWKHRSSQGIWKTRRRDGEAIYLDVRFVLPLFFV